MDSPELHVILKKMIMEQCGLSCINQEDCRPISEAIFMKNRNYISESMIKRFYGHIKGNQHYSPFVLNSLAQFVGYLNASELMQEVRVEK